jgi:hypothetical protein
MAAPQTNVAVIWSTAAVADRAAVHLERLARPPLAHSMDLAEVSGGFSSGGGRHHFVAAAPSADGPPTPPSRRTWPSHL